MKLPIYQVDAFASRLFAGNPAAIVLAPPDLSDVTMQAIAAENNLSETAFLFKGNTQNNNQEYPNENKRYQIRWFTPTIEVDLCGHATLAAAHVIFNHLNYNKQEKGTPIVTFLSKSGPLHVHQENNILWLNFPSDTLKAVNTSISSPSNRSHQLASNFLDNTDNVVSKSDYPSEGEVVSHLVGGLGITPVELYRGRDDYLAILSRESAVASLTPNMAILSQIPVRGVIVSAPGQSADFVSRFFAPQSGIPEDPVTGSAHTTLIPYWSQKLGRAELTAQQLSPRGGELVCKHLGQRVEIGGQAQTYLIGEISFN